MAARDASPTSTSSTLSHITVQTETHADMRIMSSASPSSSTPPTSLDDQASVHSDTAKQEPSGDRLETTPASLAPPMDVQGTPQPSQDMGASDGRRSARSSRKVTTYNVQILAGTAIHTPTKYLEKHHKNVLHGSLKELAPKEQLSPVRKRVIKRKSTSALVDDPVEEQLVAEQAEAARRRTSTRVTDLRKEALKNMSGVGELVTNTLSGGRSVFQNALRKSASAPNLKMERTIFSSKRSHKDMEDESSDPEDAPMKKEYVKPKTKTWLKQGLYVGQHRDFNPRLSENQNRMKKRAKKNRNDSVLPMPMFKGEVFLKEDPKHVFQDFKLPFDAYNPLPRKVKVDGWVKLGKNRFIGDASALWKREKQDSSQCYCESEDACGEACHNRIMAYECDETNCPLTEEQCQNRPFAQLKRRAKGNRYDYGVEIMQTEDRGYGVRAMRTFEPHQIIVEYAGEIITQQECERRMKQVYKKDKCYYLMSFDNKMIIDATRGTIARFVNHCCEPNCEMIKWNVKGEPRMALFAGARGVMTGEELTYDYNFDPFSQKNIQECRCGTESCRGVLGPKPKKPVEERTIASAIITGTKRKLQELWGSGRSASPSSPKKRKMNAVDTLTTKVKNALSQVENARDQAERVAEEHSRQIASRENRAIRRSITGAPKSVRARTAQGKLKSIKATRTTRVTFQHQTAKLDAARSAKQNVRAVAVSRHYKRNKGLQPNARPATPTQDAFESGSEDESVNITPASLRSATRKPVQSPQHEQRTKAVSKAVFPQRAPNTASRALKKTGAGVKKTYRSAANKARSTTTR